MDSWVQRLLFACAGAFVGGLLTFVAMYITVVGKYVSRVEVSRMIQTESPYVRDEKWIGDKFSGLVSQMEDVNEKLDELLSR